MAIYEYRCGACGSEFEEFQSIKDASVPKCAACGSDNVTRLISHSSFILKGKGWYSTDYAHRNGPGPAHPPSCSCCSSVASKSSTPPCASGECPTGGGCDD